MPVKLQPDSCQLDPGTLSAILELGSLLLQIEPELDLSLKPKSYLSANLRTGFNFGSLLVLISSWIYCLFFPQSQDTVLLEFHLKLSLSWV